MILLYEGISLLLMLFLYLALFVVVIGVITLVIGLVYGFVKKNYKNELIGTGLWLIVSPILFYLFMTICGYLIMWLI